MGRREMAVGVDAAAAPSVAPVGSAAYWGLSHALILETQLS